MVSPIIIHWIIINWNLIVEKLIVEIPETSQLINWNLIVEIASPTIIAGAWNSNEALWFIRFCFLKIDDLLLSICLFMFTVCWKKQDLILCPFSTMIMLQSAHLLNQVNFFCWVIGCGKNVRKILSSTLRNGTTPAN